MRLIVPLNWRKTYKRTAKRLNVFAKTPGFGRIYVAIAVSVLAVTTVVWSLVGASVHSSNADQLVDPYLFQDRTTFAGAQFPGSHTFLLKWPLFFLIQLVDYKPVAYFVATLAVCIATVGALTYLVYRINRQPLPFGTACLALASVLLLIPSQPYAGALLPINFAMLATRNIEYILYIGCLIGFVKTTSLRSRPFLLAVAGLSLLIASDRLFLTLSVGGALIIILVYAVLHAWKLVSLGVNWLLGTVLAAGIATIMLGILTTTGITGVVNSTGAGPYALVGTTKDLVLGGIYAVAGLLTNFGANPATSAVEIAQFPGRLFSGLFSFAGPAYLLNGLLTIGAILAVVGLIRRSLNSRTGKKVERDLSSRLVLLLVATSIVAITAFVATKHYYAVDARYLTICLFAGVLALTLRFRKTKLQPIALLATGVILTVGIIAAIPAVLEDQAASRQVLSTIDHRNIAIGRALKRHTVTTLVGDYWRTVPIKSIAPHVNIQPLASCTQTRDTLTSSVWNANLSKRSFAYLLSSEKGLTDFPACSLEQVTAVYGPPNSSLLIDGSFDAPKEQILFYDNGIQPAVPAVSQTETGTVGPISFDDLPSTVCYTPTVFNVVAHQDDDLLFMSPDLLNSIKNRDCVRTVYLTAGDGGFDQYYWAGRQQGVEMAYSNMLGSDAAWEQRIVKFEEGRYATIANPKGNENVSLIFLNLPDGNLRGEGFAKSKHESLERLRDGKIATLDSIDGQSSFNRQQLTDTLTTLMHLYQPAEIRTLANTAAEKFTDHSDHVAVTTFVDQARLQYQSQQFDDAVSIPIKYYIGYPSRERPQNVFGADLAAKEVAFLTYSRYDGGVCHSQEECTNTLTYGAYLGRQYQR